MLPFRCPRCFSENITDYVRWVAFCRNCKKEFHLTDELFDVIHQLWGKAVTGPNYDKALWARLREILYSVVHMMYKK